MQIGVFIMAASAVLPKSHPIVGLVEVDLPDGTEPTRFTRIDEQLLMVGYDPARIDRDLVEWIVSVLHGEHTLIADGVPQ